MQTIQGNLSGSAFRQYLSADKDAGAGSLTTSVNELHGSEGNHARDNSTGSLSSNEKQLQIAAKFYSKILDDVVERLERGERVKLLGTVQSRNAGTTDLQNIIIELEEKFFLEHQIPSGSSLADYRAEAILSCIYSDLYSIRDRNLSDYFRVIDSFESLLGGLIVGVLTDRDAPLPSFAEFYSRLELDSQFGRKTLPKMIGVASLCRAATLFPDHIERLEPGADFALTSLFAPTSKPKEKQPTLKERYCELGEKFKDWYLDTISPELADTLPELASFFVEARESELSACLSVKQWAKDVRVMWRDIGKQTEYDAKLAAVSKRDILVTTYRALKTKIAMATELGISWDQSVRRGAPFFCSTPRFIAASRMIDSFAINQITSVWNEKGVLPYASFAMTERRIKAYPLLPEKLGGEPRLAIEYYKLGEIVKEVFNKGGQLRDTSSALPVCIWLLNSWLTEALELGIE